VKVSKGMKRSRRQVKGKRVKKMRAHGPSDHGNTGHIHTYGLWVSEMSGLIGESKRSAFLLQAAFALT
jgi:hypothetical protein